jgi:hypothetical protein
VSAKRSPQTAAKRAREQAVREKRERKAAKKRAAILARKYPGTENHDEAGVESPAEGIEAGEALMAGEVASSSHQETVEPAVAPGTVRTEPPLLR